MRVSGTLRRPLHYYDLISRNPYYVATSTLHVHSLTAMMQLAAWEVLIGLLAYVYWNQLCLVKITARHDNNY